MGQKWQISKIQDGGRQSFENRCILYTLYLIIDHPIKFGTLEQIVTKITSDQM